ncbi:MAG TPA: hypothetical protein VK206_28360 [Anaerolineales bacterium]|nr:hypothetical protein [Anaerolineales bacterium]
MPAFQPLKGHKGNYTRRAVMFTSWLVRKDQGLHVPYHPCLEGIRQKTWLCQSQAKEHKIIFVTFGNLAILLRANT